MKLNEKQETFKNSLATALYEAWENETFKRELVASPLEAIQKLTGKKLRLKQGIEMVVVDQTDSSTFYFNIPEKPELSDMELSEEQLELVAGGGDWLRKSASALAVAASWIRRMY